MNLDNNMTHILKNDSSIKKILKMFIEGGELFFLKGFKSFMLFCQFWKLKTLVFQKMHNMVYMLFLYKPENMVKKVQVYRKNGYRAIRQASAKDVLLFFLEISKQSLFKKKQGKVAFCAFKSV